MEIKILDVLEAEVKPAFAAIIRPVLSYPAVYYQQGPYRKIRKEYEKSVMRKGTNCSYFYTGLVSRVLKYCQERGIEVEVKGKPETLEATKKPCLKNIELREEQVRLITKAIKQQRGVLVAPTGVGKTLLGLAVISAFPNVKVLWLCHTKDLMYQASDFAQKHLENFKVGYIGDSYYNPEQLTIATRQSFIKCASEIGIDYDIVIIDETHHLAKQVGQYSTILQEVFAPVRIGLTATMPKSKEAILTIEGLLGPIIDEVSIREGQERAIMADIKIRFLKIPQNLRLRELRKYSEVYDAAIVNRKEQHEIIALTAKKHVEQNESVLILVSQIEHGNNILAECRRQGIETEFAQGSTEGEIRTQLKEALNDKHIKCVIATAIWYEGVNLPELNVIVNAAGGKSEIRTIQTIGRGLRLTERKKTLIFYDCLDTSHNYLVSHIAERLCIYSEMGWL